MKRQRVKRSKKTQKNDQLRRLGQFEENATVRRNFHRKFTRFDAEILLSPQIAYAKSLYANIHSQHRLSSINYYVRRLARPTNQIEFKSDIVTLAVGVVQGDGVRTAV